MITNDAHPTVAGMNLLMVEDEMMLALSLEDRLIALECNVFVAGNVKRALKLVESENIDGALLDINLAGDRVYPVAEALDDRNISMVFMTGYNVEHIDAAWRDRPVLNKPFTTQMLEQAMTATFVHDTPSPTGRGLG